MTTKPKKKQKFSKKLLIKFGPFCIAKLLRIIYFFNKTTIEGEETIKDSLNSGKPLLVAIWHENASTILPILPKFVTEDLCALASQSSGGDLSVRMLKYFGIDSIRGSSSKGGSKALNELVKAMPHVKAHGRWPTRTPPKIKTGNRHIITTNRVSHFHHSLQCDPAHPRK